MAAVRLPRYLALALAVLLAGAAAANATRCGDDPGDAAAIAAARAAVESACPCAAATSHRAYVGCARSVIAAAPLRRECQATVRKCSTRSTCGRPGWVACCRTSAAGATSCRTLPDAARCGAPRGGSACVGAFPSCCDACTGSGCAATTTTSTTSTTTSTLPACNGFATFDPGGTVPSLPRGVAQSIPLVISGTGLFDLGLSDNGVGGSFQCPGPGCIGLPTGSFQITYTTPAGAPAVVTLTATLYPHSVGFSCGPGSGVGGGMATFPVAP